VNIRSKCDLPHTARRAAESFQKESGIPVVEDRFTRDEFYIADEAYFTGTAAEVPPIRELDRRTIGSGKPGPITYCLSLGPQLGKVPATATLNGWNQDNLKAYLTGAHFDVSNPVITQQADPTIPQGHIIHVVDANNNNAVIDGTQQDTSKVQIGWIVSTLVLGLAITSPTLSARGRVVVVLAEAADRG